MRNGVLCPKGETPPDGKARHRANAGSISFFQFHFSYLRGLFHADAVTAGGQEQHMLATVGVAQHDGFHDLVGCGANRICGRLRCQRARLQPNGFDLQAARLGIGQHAFQ